MSKKDKKCIDKFIKGYLKIPVNQNLWNVDKEKLFQPRSYFEKCTKCYKIEIKENNDYKKINKCNSRRRFILSGLGVPKSANYKCIPCYACKYYNRSLKVLLRNFMGEKDIEHEISKSILILQSINDKSKMKSLKESELMVLSYCLDGLGNVLLSCSHKEDKISTEFLDALFSFIENGDIEKFLKKKEMSHLEKAILYYWGSAHYFKRSSNRKEASFCYKKIIQVFVAFVSNSNTIFDEDLICKIKHVIFTRAISNLYAHYENTNMPEIQKIKWFFSKEMYEKIPLNLLSIFPDLEELILAYAEFELYCNRNKKFIGKLYQSTFLSLNRLVNTVSERIFALRIKGIINMKIINQLLEFEGHIYKDDFPIHFFKKYVNYYHICNEKMTLADRLKEYSCCFNEDLIQNDSINIRKELIEFLIRDTIFCLSKIIEIISPSIKTTLFSESYIGSIYKLLYECNRIFELIYMSYKWVETFNTSKCNEDCNLILKKIMGHIYDSSKMKPDEIDSELMGYLHTLFHIDEFKSACIKSSKDFFYSVLINIDKVNIHINISNYMAEMALKKFRQVREMHREGAAYKDMISNMYILDDDLNNDTSQFYIALERYTNNCLVIDNNIDDLKNICKKSSLLNVEKYIN